MSQQNTHNASHPSPSCDYPFHSNRLTTKYYTQNERKTTIVVSFESNYPVLGYISLRTHNCKTVTLDYDVT